MLNKTRGAVDILWMNQSNPYLFTATGGLDPSDVPLLKNLVANIGPTFNGTNWVSVVPAGKDFTITFTVDPTLDGQDKDKPYDSGWASVYWTLYDKPATGNFWTNEGNTPTYTYTAADAPEPGSILLFGSGILSLAGVLRRNRHWGGVNG